MYYSIGYEIAKQLADKGVYVILGCRNDKLGAEACTRLIEENKERKVVFRQVNDYITISSIVTPTHDH